MAYGKRSTRMLVNYTGEGKGRASTCRSRAGGIENERANDHLQKKNRGLRYILTTLASDTDPKSEQRMDASLKYRAEAAIFFLTRQLTFILYEYQNPLYFAQRATVFRAVRED